MKFWCSQNLRLVLCVSLLTVLGSLSFACSAKYPNRNPLGELFPAVQGKSLSGDAMSLPKDLAAPSSILLVGYKQNSQFDIDRWLLGLFDSGVDVPIYELPTIPGVLPGMIAKTIDGGMRSGIPNEMWDSVVTIYQKDAKSIASFTGNASPLNARVLLINDLGEVLYFHDQGYSVSHLRQLTSLIAKTDDALDK